MSSNARLNENVLLQFCLAHFIRDVKFLAEHPDIVTNFIRANVELTDWINSNLPEAKKLLNQQIQKETRVATWTESASRFIAFGAGLLRNLREARALRERRPFWRPRMPAPHRQS